MRKKKPSFSWLMFFFSLQQWRTERRCFDKWNIPLFNYSILNGNWRGMNNEQFRGSVCEILLMNYFNDFSLVSTNSVLLDGCYQCRTLHPVVYQRCINCRFNDCKGTLNSAAETHFIGPVKARTSITVIIESRDMKAEVIASSFSWNISFLASGNASCTDSSQKKSIANSPES